MSFEVESPSFLDEEIRNEVFTWLSNARYWLGYMVAINGENYGVLCHELEYGWNHSNWEIIASITPLSNRSPYYRMFEGTSREFRHKTFEYKIPSYPTMTMSADLKLQKTTFEIEYLIEHFFPGIHRCNTWAVCNFNESENCIGKNNGEISLCGVFGETMICGECLRARTEKGVIGFEGFVYLIGNHEQKIYKIGLSRQPKESYKAFRTKLPDKVEVIHQIETTNMRKAEMVLLHWMSDKNDDSEWYNLSQSDIDFLCNLASFENDNFIDNLGNIILDFPK